MRYVAQTPATPAFADYGSGGPGMGGPLSKPSLTGPSGLGVSPVLRRCLLLRLRTMLLLWENLAFQSPRDHVCSSKTGFVRRPSPPPPPPPRGEEESQVSRPSVRPRPPELHQPASVRRPTGREGWAQRHREEAQTHKRPAWGRFKASACELFSALGLEIMAE